MIRNTKLKLKKRAQELFKHGKEYMHNLDFDNAINYFTNAIRLNPINFLFFYYRGNAWQEMKEYSNAIDDYSEAIKLKSDDAHLYYSRGYVQFCIERYGYAISDFNEAIRFSPNETAYYTFRGISYKRQKQFHNAIKDFKIILSIDTVNSFAVEELKDIRIMKEKYPDYSSMTYQCDNI